MSIAEKLTTVAENQPKVYDAGFKKAIERYAPEFTESGASVVCYPIGGFSLNVVSQITPIQAGSGDPSPTNPRPLSAHTAVKVTIANETDSAEYNTELPAGAYCGTFDWSTGLLTLTHKMLTLTGSESTSSWKVSVTDVYTTGLISDHEKTSQSIHGWCSHTPRSGIAIDGTYLTHTNKTVGGLSFNKVVSNWGYPEVSVAAHMAFLKAQYEAGTPVQILYKLGVPITVQLTPQEILALDGTNTIQSTTGDTTVTGKGDWYAMVANLATEADYQAALREMGVNV